MKNKKKIKKPNISLKRKITVYYARTKCVLKFLIIGFLVLFLFTDSFVKTKKNLLDSIFEFTGSIGFKVKTLEIAGSVNLTKEEIASIAGIKAGQPTLKLNLKALQNKLKQNCWVKNVIVSRKLPHTVSITLVENNPVAIWQINKELFLIDKDGNKITSNYNSKKFKDLLHVVGLGANISANCLITKLENTKELSRHIVSAVRLEDRRWNLNFRQGITAEMPENVEHFDKALKYLERMYSEQKLFDQNYKTLDLRDDNKYYLEYY